MIYHWDGLAPPEQRNERLETLLNEHKLTAKKYICQLDYRVIVVTSDGNLEGVGDSEMEALEQAFSRLRRVREGLNAQ